MKYEKSQIDSASVSSRYDKVKREAFCQDAINSWNEHRKTGLHVTGEEVVAWLDTWGEENEKAAPICHK